MTVKNVSPQVAAGFFIILVIMSSMIIMIHRQHTSDDVMDISPSDLSTVHSQSALVFGRESAPESIDVILEPQCPTCHMFMKEYVNRRLLNTILSGRTVVRLYPVSFLSSDGISSSIINSWAHIYTTDSSRFKLSTLKLIRDTSSKFVIGHISQNDISRILGIDINDMSSPDTVTLSSHIQSSGKKYVSLIPDDERATPVIIHNGMIVNTASELHQITQ